MIEISSETSLERKSQAKCSPGANLRRDSFICDYLFFAWAAWGDIQKYAGLCELKLNTDVQGDDQASLCSEISQYMPLADMFCSIIKGLSESRDERICSYFLQKSFQSWSFTSLWEVAISS